MKEKYDAILIFNNQLNEASRIKPGVNNASHRGPNNYVDVDDPAHYTSNAIGRIISQSIDNMGYGYFGEVTDFGKWVVVTVGYHSYITGRSCTKTFLVVFNNDKNYSSVVMSSSTKWRTITNHSEAVTYIRAAANQLASEANKRL